MTDIPPARLFLADARKIKSFISKESVDLIISGPPYWNLVKYSGHDGQLSKIEDYSVFLGEIKPVWEGCRDALKPGGILAIWVHDFFKQDLAGSHSYIPFHQDILGTFPAGLELKNIIIWDRYLNRYREGLMPAGTRVQYVIIFQKEGRHQTNGQLIDESLAKSYWNPVWSYKTQSRLLGSKLLFKLAFLLSNELSGSRLFNLKFLADKFIRDSHRFTNYTTECPPEIAAKLITEFSKPGDTVMDPFLGSGTSMKVALGLNRQCVGVEVNTDAVASIKKKLGDISPSIKEIV